MVLGLEFARAGGLLLIALSSIGFSVQSGLVHYIGKDVCTMQQIGIRGAVAWLFVCISLFRTFGKPSQSWLGSRDVRCWILLRGLAGFSSNTFAFMALAEAASLGDASALIFSFPIFTVVYGVFLLGERPSRVVLSSVLIGVVGALLVARPAFLGFAGASSATLDVRSCAFGLASAACGGLTFITLRRTRGECFLVVLSSQFGTQAVLGHLGAALTCGLRLDVAALEWCILLSYGVFAFFEQLSMTLGARQQGAAAGSAMRTLDVVISYGIQLVLFPSDSFAFVSFLGATMICASIVALVAEQICGSPASTEVVAKVDASVKDKSAFAKLPQTPSSMCPDAGDGNVPEPEKLGA